MMSLVRSILAFGLMSACWAANAADYLHVNGHNQHWASDILALLQKDKPVSPGGVTIGMTPDFDIHVYVVPGTFTGIYTIQRMRHAPDRANAAVKAILDGGTGMIIGFQPRQPQQQGQPPETPNAPGQGDANNSSGNQGQSSVYLLTWTKPAS
jgi:hypothetical protein